MLDPQTAKLLIGVLFLFIAYSMYVKHDKTPQRMMYSFAGIGAIVLAGWLDKDGSGRMGCL